MPLLQPRTRTPALLAANRLSAQQSTRPRTPQGKARVALNALKHGRYAVALREKIIRTGDREADRRYRWLRSEVAHTFRPQDSGARRQVEQLANQLWCQGRVKSGTKPISGVLSTENSVRGNVLSPTKKQQYRNR